MSHFLASVPLRPGEIVSAYRPIFSELDPTPLMMALHERGVVLCVPVILGEARPLAFRVWTPDATMIVGAFGAEIPEDDTEVEPTLLIAPMLAFDRNLWRLGYGGGFYDRTLEGLRATRPTRAIGYAYAEQEVDAVPIEPTDQPLDGVVTQDGLISRVSS
jgi:5-formyltetrahydrofolate cyclo-ligase